MDERYRGGSSSGAVRVDPEELVRSARRFDGLAGALADEAAAVPAWTPDAGFDSGTAAAGIDADLVAGVRAHAARARAVAEALRATATTWRTADDAAAATFHR